MDAMNSGFYPKTFIFSRLNLLDEFPFDLEKRLNMVQIPYRNIQTWSDLSTSPGIMGKKMILFESIERYVTYDFQLYLVWKKLNYP